MRPLSILTALLVTLALYLLVMERDRVLRMAGADAAEGGAAESVRIAGPDHATTVVVIVSDARDVDTVVRLRGRTEAARRVDVMAETSGRIVSAPLRKGAFVAAGDTLCRLDPGTRAAALAESAAALDGARAAVPTAEARIAAGEAQLAEARIGRNAADRLSEDGFASETRVAAAAAAVEAGRAAIEAARAELQSARAGVERAKAALAAARTEIERLEIAAPFEGVLETDSAELGALMQTGEPCATVIQLDPMKLVGFVPELAVDRIAPGRRAQARLASGRPLEGRVSFVSRVADPETRTFRVEIDVANPDLSIRDGQTAEIAVGGEGSRAHVLPPSALTLNDAGDLGVRVADAGDVARFRPVEILRDTPEGVYVTGLNDRERVIVVGQDFVGDGVPVAVSLRDAAP